MHINQIVNRRDAKTHRNGQSRRHVTALILLLAASLWTLPLVAVAQDGAGAQAQYEQGEQALRKGKMRDAEKHFLLALRADETHTQSALGLSEVYLMQRRYEDGLKVIKKALKDNSDDAALWARQGHLLRDAGKMKQARRSYDRAAELAPEDPEILQQVAGFYNHTGNRVKAEDLSQKRDRVLEKRARDEANQ